MIHLPHRVCNGPFAENPPLIHSIFIGYGRKKADRRQAGRFEMVYSGHHGDFHNPGGTGGTVSGVGRYLKAQNPAVRVVAFEPASSPLLTEGHAGPHGLQGIGANFVPENLDRSVLDEVLTVTDADAYGPGAGPD